MAGHVWLDRKPPKRLALVARLLYHRRRTGGRVVDGTALEMRRTCKGSVGSNPTLSAKISPIQLIYHHYLGAAYSGPTMGPTFGPG